MKIDELKRIAKENDYEYSKRFRNYTLVREDNYININSVCENRIWISITDWCDDKDFNMIKASMEFAETPPEDREEEKKFYLRHRWFKSPFGDNYYLRKYNYSAIGMTYGIVSTSYFKKVDYMFTMAEIEEIKIKFDTDLADFELVEV